MKQMTTNLDKIHEAFENALSFLHKMLAWPSPPDHPRRPEACLNKTEFHTPQLRGVSHTPKRDISVFLCVLFFSFPFSLGQLVNRRGAKSLRRREQQEKKEDSLDVVHQTPRHTAGTQNGFCRHQTLGHPHCGPRGGARKTSWNKQAGVRGSSLQTLYNVVQRQVTEKETERKRERGKNDSHIERRTEIDRKK